MKHRATIVAVIALAALTGWSLWQRYAFLTSSPDPMGVDGYFYAIQVRSLLRTGALYYPSAPLCFWFMAPLAALSDPITGAKLGAALAGALAVPPAYVLGRRVSGSRGCGLLAAVLVATSAESMYLTTEFVKNSLGLTLALTYGCALAWALGRAAAAKSAEPDSPRAWPGALVPAGLLVAVFATHKLAAAVAVIASVAPLIVAWRQGVRPRSVRAVAYALAAAVTLAIAAGAAAPERFLWVGDLRLLGDAFTTEADWSFAALRVPGGSALVFQHEVALAGALAIFALLCYPLSRDSGTPATGGTPIDRAFVLGPAVLGVLVALPCLDIRDPQGVAFRLRLIAFVPLALCAAAVCGVVTTLLGPRWRVLIVPFTAAFFFARPVTPGEGVVTVHPAMRAAVGALRGVVPAKDVIIVPERHLAFMATWYLDNPDSPVRLRPEPVPRSRRWRLLPMAFMTADLRAALERARTRAPAHIPRPRSVHPHHPDGLVVMPETTWQWILAQLPERARRYYRRWNTI